MGTSRKVREAIFYIKNSWKEGKSLKEISAMFNLHPANLERAFREHEDITVKAYIDQHRKEFVLAVLRRSEILGYVLGKELGFPTGLAFYRWVKRVFGKSFKKLNGEHIGEKKRKRGNDKKRILKIRKKY